MKYDIENFHSDILGIIQNELPTKLSEISTEKGDGIVIPVADNSDYYDSLSNEIINSYPFVFHGVSNVDTKSDSYTEEKIELFFDVCFLNEENEDNSNLFKIALRYNRALKEILDEKNTRIAQVSRLEVKELPPRDMKLLDQEEVYKTCGVIVSANLVG